jgi:hypothetical protein
MEKPSNGVRELTEERKGLLERLKTRKTIIMREPLLARLERKLHGELAPAYYVRYIDLTTGKTREKTVTERELPDLYMEQREGKISIIEIHKLKETSPQVTRLAVDKVLESKRETKKREWLTKGYSPFLVEKGLLLADEWVASLAETWAPGMPEIQKVIVEKNYDRALDVADRWLKAMMA